MKMAVIWDVALCSLIDIYRRSQVLTAPIFGVMMMEVLSTAETPVSFCHTARHDIPDDSHLCVRS
jgi:hypothetical protein